jgi:uncharacterized protein (TIGR00730 family)
MGYVARSALEAQGKVICLSLTQDMDSESLMVPPTEFVLCDSLLERKKELFSRADAFIALPGGWATLGHLVDVICDKKERSCTKPFILLNTLGYWDPFLRLMVAMKAEGFLDETQTSFFKLCHTPQEALLALTSSL